MTTNNQIKAKITGISNIKVGMSTKHNDEGNREIVCKVAFECRLLPHEFENVLIAEAAQQQVDIVISSPQSIMDMLEKSDDTD